MSGTTANKGLPYPTSSDLVTDGAQAIQDLATALDTEGVWQDYVPAITGVATSTVEGRYTRVGGLVVFRGYIVLSAAPTAEIKISLPVPDAPVLQHDQTTPIGTVIALRQGSAFRVGHAFLATTGGPGVKFISDGSGGGAWAAGVPSAWNATDQMAWNVTYEAA